MATRSRPAPPPKKVERTVSIRRPFKVTFTREDVGGYSASVPELPGCYSEGDTLAEAQRNIREAIGGFLVALEKAQRLKAKLARAAGAEA